jgi:hypothetical protein
VFTKPRSRATPGAGVSTPFPIYLFHSPRGKRAKRALREIALLCDVGVVALREHTRPQLASMGES